jgi:CheY-like chemotaxis protein
MRVLLVEDTPSARLAFGKLLRLSGYDVCEASDGQQALDCVAGFQPQVVLTDLMMPEIDGIELIRRLHENPETARLPVVAITATVHAERLAREAGACDVIAKPIDFPLLLERLDELNRATD